MTTSPFTTPQAVESLRPNVHVFPPADLIPNALVIAATTKVATIEGDEPIVRARFLDVGEAGFTPEGDEIDENEVDSREVEIATGKITIYTLVSREQYGQDGFKNLMSEELKRAVTLKADNAFLTQEAPAAGKHTPPPGLLVQDHEEGGTIDDDLDALSDAIATIESNNGTADLIIASPLSWAAVSKIKTGEDSNESLLGPPAIAAARQLLSIPVTVSASVEDDVMIVLDRRAVLSAYGPLQVALSEHVAFRRDSIATRLTWRIGAAITHPERVVELSVPGAVASGTPVKKAAKKIAD